MPEKPSAGREILGTHRVARLLSVDVGTVIRWVDAGRLAGFRTPGGHRRVLRQEVFRFMQRHGWMSAAAAEESSRGKP